MTLLPRLALLLGVLVGGASLPSVLCASSGPYALSLELWVDGEREAIEQPLIVGENDTPSILETQSGYRFEFSLNGPNDAYVAEDSLWLNIGVYEQDPIDLSWVFVTDTLLGTVQGKPQTFSLAGDREPVTKRNAALYLIVKVDKR